MPSLPDNLGGIRLSVTLLTSRFFSTNSETFLRANAPKILENMSALIEIVDFY